MCLCDWPELVLVLEHSNKNSSIAISIKFITFLLNVALTNEIHSPITFVFIILKRGCSPMELKVIYRFSQA